MDAPRCPVRGHDHEVCLHRVATQKGTGSRANIWECPTGRYRWFQLEERTGEPLDDAPRMARPRFGWRG